MKPEAVPEALRLMDGWVHRLATELPEPIRAPLPNGDFQWRYPVESLNVVILCKAVRLTTALAGAWELANRGLTPESGSLLRLVGDFASELWFLVEASLKERETADQQRFVSHFFRPMARTPDEYLEQERLYYVSRRDITKAERRLSEEAGVDAEHFTRLSVFLNYGFNGYAHGAYETAMEIYHGGCKRFMLMGVDGRPRAAAVQIVASKATEACLAIGGAALAFKLPEIKDELDGFLRRVDPDAMPKGEQSS